MKRISPEQIADMAHRLADAHEVEVSDIRLTHDAGAYIAHLEAQRENPLPVWVPLNRPVQLHERLVTDEGERGMKYWVVYSIQDFKNSYPREIRVGCEDGRTLTFDENSSTSFLMQQ